MAGIRARWACGLATIALALAGIGVALPADAQEPTADTFDDAVQVTEPVGDPWEEDPLVHVEGDAGVETDVTTDEASELQMDTSESETLRTESGIIASGTWGTCPWEISSKGVLTVHPGVGEDGCPSWAEYRGQITSVRFLKESGAKVVAPGSCAYLLSGHTALKSVNASGLDVSHVTNMQYIFQGCSSLTSLDLSGWDTSSVTDMDEMFQGCSSLNAVKLSGATLNGFGFGSLPDDAPLETVDLTGAKLLGSAGGMFRGCSFLANIGLVGVDTTGLESTGAMFSGCSSLKP